MKKPWTEDEILFLKDNLNKLSYKQIALVLMRTSGSVSQKARKLDIKKPIIKEPHIPEDLTGKRYGKLLVIKLSEKTYSKKRWTMWECLCDCGNTPVVMANNLKRNGSNSCKNCTNLKPAFQTISKRAYEQHWRNAKRRNYDNNLTQELYTEIIKLPCTYCGQFSIRKNVNTGITLELNSVDRKNNEPYYKLENSQPVCFICQAMKSDMTHKEFLCHMNNINNYVKK